MTSDNAVIGSMFRQILENRIKEILKTNELPVIFRKKNSGHFPIGCCCSDCIRVYNPIKKGEYVFSLYPSNGRRIGIIRAYCVAKYSDKTIFEDSVNA